MTLTADITFNLIFHIIVGSVAVIAGYVALFVKKGAKNHRLSGKIFVISMFLMTSTGAILGYIKPATISLLVGIFTFYLVATSWMTVKRKTNEVGAFEVVALLVVIGVFIGFMYFGNAAAKSETGTIEDVPITAEGYFFFAVFSGLCVILDIRMLIYRGIEGHHRIARHLWRMCFAMYIAVASIFLGNPQVFPENIQGSLVLAAPVLIVVLVMLYYLIRVLFTKMYKR